MTGGWSGGPGGDGSVTAEAENRGPAPIYINVWTPDAADVFQLRQTLNLQRARTAKEPSYAKTYSVVEAIYGSPRLQLPFEGLLLVGY